MNTWPSFSTFLVKNSLAEKNKVGLAEIKLVGPLPNFVTSKASFPELLILRKGWRRERCSFLKWSTGMSAVSGTQET